MSNIKEIHNFLSLLAPSNLSESWDNDGIMLCKSLDLPVKKVLVALEIRNDVIDYAVKGGFDLIVTHHPFIFRKLSRVCANEYAKLEKLINNGISVLSYHTRLDSAEGGVNDVLSEVLCLTEVSGFGGEQGNIGRIGFLEKTMSDKEFTKHLKDKLGCDIRCTPLTDKPISKVAVVGGSGKDFVYDALGLHADAFVTSEVPHHIFIDSAETGLLVCDCGHYYTENPVCQKLYTLLKQSFTDIYAEIFDVKCPYTCIL